MNSDTRTQQLLAIDIADAALHAYEKRRVAWGTALGGVISVAMMTVLGVLVGASGYFIAGLIVTTQVFRTLWLGYKAFRAGQECDRLQCEAAFAKVGIPFNHVDADVDDLLGEQPPQ